MSNNSKSQGRLGAKGNTIILVVCIVALAMVLFGGKGTNAADMNRYATEYETGNPGSVQLFDVGTRSKVAVIRHGDGSLTGIAFRKIPLLDRWKVTNETMPFAEDTNNTVWISVDDGFSEYTVVSDGEILTDVANHGWYGTYANVLRNLAFGLVLIFLFEVGKRLYRRRQENKNANTLPE